MDQQHQDQRLEQLARRVEELESRVANLESGVAGIPAQPDSTGAAVSYGGAVVSRRHSETVPLIGRTLLILAGAFVLRAITEAGTLNQTAGTSLGILYSLAWFILADRAAGKGREMAAVFYGLAGAIIAFPLLAESTVKFDVLVPGSTALILVAVSGVALAVAWRRNLVWMAWVISLGSAATLIALAVATRELPLFVACLLLLGLATLWFGYVKGWKGLGWTIAAAADGAVLMLGIIMLMGETEVVVEILDPAALLTLQLSMVAAYIGSFMVRTLTSQEDVQAPEMLQGLAVILISMGGAHAIALKGVVSDTVPGMAGLIVAAACYAVAFLFIDRKLGRRGNFIFYTTAGLAFTLAAMIALLHGPRRVLALAGIALVVSWLGGARERATLSLHGALYILAATAGSGLAPASVQALAGPSVPDAGWIAVPVLAVLAVSAVYCWFRVATHGRTWGDTLSRVPKFLVLAILALGLGGIVATVGAGLLPAGEQGVPAMAAVAPLRTLILAVSAVFLAWSCRFARLEEAAWLVYPVLVAGGLKLLLEDLRSGGPATLVASFALYGGSLILAPRLVRRGRRVTRSAAPPTAEGS